VYQVGGNRSVYNTQDLAHRLRVSSEQKAQGKGEADHPLAQRYIGKYFVSQRSRFRMG